jgi:hypothetical protein
VVYNVLICRNMDTAGLAQKTKSYLGFVETESTDVRINGYRIILVSRSYEQSVAAQSRRKMPINVDPPRLWGVVLRLQRPEQQFVSKDDILIFTCPRLT